MIAVFIYCFASARRFAEDVVKPLVREMDEKSEMHPSIIKGLFDLGVMGTEIESEYGGTGSSFMVANLIIEELARIDPAVSVFCDVQNTLINTLIRRYGTSQQKNHYLPRLSTNLVSMHTTKIQRIYFSLKNAIFRIFSVLCCP